MEQNKEKELIYDALARMKRQVKADIEISEQEMNSCKRAVDSYKSGSGTNEEYREKLDIFYITTYRFHLACSIREIVDSLEKKWNEYYEQYGE